MAERLLLTFSVDNTGAIKQVDKLEREVKESGDEATKAGRKFDGMSGGIKASTAVAVAAIAGMVMAVRGLGRVMSQNLSMAAEQESILIDLASSMARAGESYVDNAADLQGLFSEIQKFTKYGDTDTAAALEKLTTLSGDFDAAMTVLIPTLDAASATGTDLNVMAETMGKALAGNVGTLSRYGIVLDEATAKQLKNANEMERAQILASKLSDQFGGAAQAELAGYNAKIQQLGNYWGDARESMGQAIITLLEAQGGTEGMRGSLEGLVNWVNEVAVSFVWFASLSWSDLIVAQFLKLERVWLGVVASILKQLRLLASEFARIPGVGAGGMTDLVGGLTGAIDGLEHDIETLGGVINDLETEAIEPADEAARLLTSALKLGVSEAAVTAAEKAGELTNGLVDQQTEVSELTRLQNLAKEKLGEVAGKYQYLHLRSMELERSSADLGYIIEHEVVTPFDQAAKNATAFGFIIDDLNRQLPGLAAQLETSMGDVLFEAFTADFEGILDAFDNLFGSISSMAADKLSSQLMEGLTGGGFDLQGMAATAGVGIGMGMLGGAMESGSIGMGMLGGALAGAGLGTMILPGIGTAIGAGIGAVVGGITSWLASSNPANSFIRPDEMGGFEVGTRGKDNGLGAVQREMLEQQLGELYDQTAMAWRDALQSFGDADLFDLLRESGGLDTGWVELDAAGMAAYFSDQVLPPHFRRRFKRAINTGLRDLGVTGSTIREFWDEWETLGAEAGLEALQTFVAALSQSADLLAAGDWDSIMGEIGKSPIERWSEFIGEASGQIDLLRVGWDQMSLPDRATEMLQINATYQQALQGTLQLMAQIDAMRQSINQGWDSLRESIALDSMTDGQKISYFSDRIAELMAELGQTTDPNEIGQINSELQRYIQSLAGLTENDAFFNWGTTWGEHLEDLIDQAQALANAQLDQVETSVKEEWEALTAQVQEARDNLAGFNDVLKNLNDGDIDMSVEFDPTINVTVENNTEVPLSVTVRAIVEEILGGNPPLQ